ncbi:MAG: hypothetical protein H6581_25635 [Bacteroidia bacterium]|nr:hypothetical protein [Bacteroidia bacterium]
MDPTNPFLRKREQVFEYEDGPFYAELRINEMPGEEFTFFLWAQDRNEDLKTSIFGSATLSQGDLESRDDEGGDAYFVRELIYNGPEGRVRILTDLDHQFLSWVELEGCDSFKGPLVLPVGRTWRVVGG